MLNILVVKTLSQNVFFYLNIFLQTVLQVNELSEFAFQIKIQIEFPL